jgi:GT2 family glycosyltransferase
MAKPPSVSVVVLNWNGLTDTLACVHSLRALRYPAHIVIVDNASTDGSVEALRNQAPDHGIDLLECDQNLGYAGGNNVGIRYALDQGADFILVLNNDTIVDPTLLDELLGAAGRYPEAGCFGPWIFYMHDPERLWYTRSEWASADGAFTAPGKGRLAAELPLAPTSTEYVCGAALFFRAEVARKVGLFDERFFLVYEDSDWGFRARRAGFECMAVPSARVWHKVGTSFGSESSPLRTYFSVRNKLLWAEKNVPRPELFRIFRDAAGRLFPRLRIEWRTGVPRYKSLLWALNGFGREWSRKLHDPQEAAHRQGILDYAFRRFGDCPPKIRALAKTWAAVRGPAAAPEIARN